MYSNDVSVFEKTTKSRPIIDSVAIREATVNEIIEKYLYRILTPDILRQIKFELQQKGYDIQSLTSGSKDHIFGLENEMEEDIKHFYFDRGMWESETI